MMIRSKLDLHQCSVVRRGNNDLDAPFGRIHEHTQIKKKQKPEDTNIFAERGNCKRKQNKKCFYVMRASGNDTYTGCMHGWDFPFGNTVRMIATPSSRPTCVWLVLRVLLGLLPLDKHEHETVMTTGVGQSRVQYLPLWVKM